MKIGGFLPWLLKDLRELAAVFNWFFLFLFAWTIVWGVRHHPEICLNTAINATASLAAIIFSNYIWCGHMDRKLDVNANIGNVPANQVVNNVPGSKREPGLDG